ncbi:uncharacterized protein LOC116300861 [Actinia tenebrosa]|uniref:Uncharacterized protein LOC116300861 n=1 Tax=Actinia tenebrosa TaxID=6105 RepID=A0A6P8IG76_ACTTE|nr:uncharacterized protein LOC116300861 [Actinia tenebrosa]
MLQKWMPEFANRSTEAYKRMHDTLVNEISKVLQITKEGIRNVNFTKGSIVARFEVVYTFQSQGNVSKDMEDPEKALRNAIQSGQLRDLHIDPESLVVSQSFSGVNLTSWTSKPDECSSKCHNDKHNSKVEQNHECAEVTASCDDVPLTRETTCHEACPAYSSAHASRKEMFIIIGVLIVAVVIAVGVVVIIKCKRDRHKHISTSPSISSMKQLTNNDELQSRC